MSRTDEEIEEGAHEDSPNTNCLDGWQCPECKSWGPFRVEATVSVILHDDGTEDDPDNGDTNYDSDNFAACIECDYEATVGDFQKGAESDD